MNSNQIKISIRGMHCRSCELLVEENLKELDNIEKVEVNYHTGEATIYYNGSQPSEAALKNAVISAGYEIGNNDLKPTYNFSSDNILELITGAGILFVLYLVFKALGLTDITLNPDVNEPSFGLVLLVGLVAGVSTCMAMIGGLLLGVSSKFIEKHPTATRAERFRPHLFLVGGRIIGYAFFGGLLGLAGSVFELSNTVNASLTLLVGALMLFMGLQLTNLFPRLSAYSFSLPPTIAKLFGITQKQREYSHKHAAVLGALTFFLPCGFTQTMQVYAVSRGNFLEGAIIMGLFALGTAPGLLGIGGLTATVKSSFRSLFFKTAGIAIIALSLFNITNGYTLLAAGLDFGNGAETTETENITDPNVTFEDGYQVVRMTETNSGYSPNKFTIKKGVPVKWIVDAQAPYSCASALGIPKLKLQKFLKAGENIIEFTATETGPLKFSCSMGMYTGVFNVVDDETSKGSSLDTKDAEAAAPDEPAVAASTCGGPSGGGCGCGGGKKAPAKTNEPPVIAKTITDDSSNEAVQIIKTTYTEDKYLDPSNFTVKAGAKVRFEIEVKDDGVGCGRQIALPELTDEVYDLDAGTNVVFEFTPNTPGLYNITCGMQMMQFGTIVVE